MSTVIDEYSIALRYLPYGDVYGLRQCKSKHGDVYHFETTSILAATGNTPCIEYAIQDGCGWHYLTAQNAVQYNQMETLLFVLHQGCEISYSCLMISLEKNNLACANICLQYGISVEIQCSIEAVKSGSVECMQWYKSHTPHLPNRWLQICGHYAVQHNKIEILHFLYEDGFTFGSFELLQAFDYLYNTSFTFILRCLYENRVELNPTYLSQLNKKASRLDIERWEVRQFLFDYEERRLLGFFPALRLLVKNAKDKISKTKQIIRLLDIVHDDMLEYVLGKYL